MKALTEYRGSRICYRHTGEGPAIIFLHGFLEDMSMWDDFAKQLSKNYQVIAIDLPGFGESECIEPAHSMEEMAAVVNKVLIHLNVDKCLMVGHSMGGYVSLAFAKAFPEKLKGLCLFHSHAMPDTAEAKRNRDRAIAVIESDRGGFIINFFPDLFAPENVETFEEDISAMHEAAMKITPQAIVAALEGMKNRQSQLDVLINATWPVLFILGKKDSRIPFQTALAQAALPPRGEILILDHVGHMGHLEAGEDCMKMIECLAGKTL
jgi:pimeloyl-ACP methyl ester carboxylesterase